MEERTASGEALICFSLLAGALFWQRSERYARRPLSQPAQLVTTADAAGECVSTVDAGAGQPMTATALPADVLDHIARQLGFRGWAALKYFSGCSSAPCSCPTTRPRSTPPSRPRPTTASCWCGRGLYKPGESVGVTRDLTCAVRPLGPRGSVVVQPPGWEAGLVWGTKWF